MSAGNFVNINVDNQRTIIPRRQFDTLTLAGAGIVTITTDPVTNTITITGTGDGVGDVVGPASATDNAIVRFDSTTGKLVQNSAATIADTSGNITAGTYNGNTIGSGSTSGTNTGDQTNISGNAATVTTNANLTGPVTSTGNATVIKSCIPFFATTGADGTYTLVGRMPFGGTIDSTTTSTVSGTCTLAVKINGTSVTDNSAISVTSTPGTTAATAANTFATGDIITIVISASSSPVGLSITVNLTGSAA